MDSGADWRGQCPKTQEEFDTWCDETIARNNAYEAKKAEEKAKREAREAIPGYKAHKNWKRCDTEIRKMREEMERIANAMREMEGKKAYWARKYEEETGKAV